MGYNLLASPARSESDVECKWNVKCGVSKTSKNAASPREPVKLMIRTDSCTKTKSGENGLLYKKEVKVQVTVYFTIG